MSNAHVPRYISSGTDTTYIKHRLCKTSTMMTEKTSTKRGCSRSGFKWPIEGLVHRSWESVLCTLPDPVKAKPSLGRLFLVPRWWKTCTSALGTAPTLSPVTLQDPPIPIKYLAVRAWDDISQGPIRGRLVLVLSTLRHPYPLSLCKVPSPPPTPPDRFVYCSWEHLFCVSIGLCWKWRCSCSRWDGCLGRCSYCWSKNWSIC